MFIIVEILFIVFDVVMLCGIDICECIGCFCIYDIKIDLGSVVEMVLFFFSGKFYFW